MHDPDVDQVTTICCLCSRQSPCGSHAACLSMSWPEVQKRTLYNLDCDMSFLKNKEEEFSMDARVAVFAVMVGEIVTDVGP
jgi:hypothetical protein